ncbi:hypothetical protein CFP56_002302, partial [Quercus suber]
LTTKARQRKTTFDELNRESERLFRVLLSTEKNKTHIEIESPEGLGFAFNVANFPVLDLVEKDFDDGEARPVAVVKSVNAKE